MKNLAILQARTDSTRFPGKVLKAINGKPMIEWQIRRIQQSVVKDIVLATSLEDSDNELVDTVEKLGIDVFRGSLTDVHSRFVAILKIHNPVAFIRLTGDCPVVMPSILNKMLDEFESYHFDYFSNIHPPTYPDGLDIEIISTKAFFEFSKEKLTDKEKEHVTLGMRHRLSSFKFGNFEGPKDYSKMRWTVDYEEDYIFIRNVFDFFKGKEIEFTFDDIVKAVESGSIPDNVISHDFRNIALNEGVELE